MRHSTRNLPHGWERENSDIFESCFEKMISKTLSARIGSRISYEVGAKKDIATISAAEEDAFTRAWPNGEFRRKVVPGKAVFSEIAGKVQDKFAVTLTPARIIDELRTEDIHPELFEILRDIHAHLGELSKWHGLFSLEEAQLPRGTGRIGPTNRPTPRLAPAAVGI